MDAGRRAVRWASPDATVRILRYHVPVPAVRHGPIGIVVEFAEFVQVRVDGRLAAEEDELLARVSRRRQVIRVQVACAQQAPVVRCQTLARGVAAAAREAGGEINE